MVNSTGISMMPPNKILITMPRGINRLFITDNVAADTLVAPCNQKYCPNPVAKKPTYKSDNNVLVCIVNFVVPKNNQVGNTMANAPAKNQKKF